jgi:hypothetical protein
MKTKLLIIVSILLFFTILFVAFNDKIGLLFESKRESKDSGENGGGEGNNNGNDVDNGNNENGNSGNTQLKIKVGDYVCPKPENGYFNVRSSPEVNNGFIHNKIAKVENCNWQVIDVIPSYDSKDGYIWYRIKDTKSRYRRKGYARIDAIEKKK